MSWTPRLDDVDRAILEHLREVGDWRPLRYLDLHDTKATRALSRDELVARVEILIEAGLVRRADEFLLVEQAAGRDEATTDHLGTVVVAETPPEAPSPAEPVDLPEAA